VSRRNIGFSQPLAQTLTERDDFFALGEDGAAETHEKVEGFVVDFGCWLMDKEHAGVNKVLGRMANLLERALLFGIGATPGA